MTEAQYEQLHNELQRVYGLVDHWYGETVRLRALRLLDARGIASELAACYSRTGLESFIVRHFPDSYLAPQAARETPGELEQLRRTDQAARVYMEDRTHGNYSKLCDALFDGRERTLTEDEKYFNGLTAAEAERLALLAEECGELVQAIGKALRHGYDSNNPLTGGPTNRQSIEREVGDVYTAIWLMFEAKDIRRRPVAIREEVKRQTLPEYLHHAGVPTMSTLTSDKRVRCPVCTKRVSIRRDGKLSVHRPMVYSGDGRRVPPCTGSGVLAIRVSNDTFDHAFPNS